MPAQPLSPTNASGLKRSINYKRWRISEKAKPKPSGSCTAFKRRWGIVGTVYRELTASRFLGNNFRGLRLWMILDDIGIACERNVSQRLNFEGHLCALSLEVWAAIGALQVWGMCKLYKTLKTTDPAALVVV